MEGSYDELEALEDVPCIVYNDNEDESLLHPGRLLFSLLHV